MGANTSITTCTLNPTGNNYSCLGNNVKFQNPSESLFQTYLVTASNNAFNQEITYSFGCKIDEKQLFGKVYCNAGKDLVRITCGTNSSKFKVNFL